MKDMEREKFEASWKNAFEKAEVTPSEQVWRNIELDLEKAKGTELRRRLMFYKLLAAASIVFAMAVGGAGVFHVLRSPSPAFDQLAAEQDAPHQPSTTPTPQWSPPSAGPSMNGPQADVSADLGGNAARDPRNTAEGPRQQTVPGDPEDPAIARNQNNASGIRAAAPASLAGHSRKGGTGSQRQQEAVALAATGNGAGLPQDIQFRTLPPLHSPQRIELILPVRKKQEVDPVLKMLATLEQREKELQGGEESKREAGRQENLWTSVGFAAGSFRSVQSATSGSTPPPSPAMSALATPIVDEETSASGYSYSMGVNVGTRISEKWVLQGGVNYLSQSSEYTANNVVVASTAYQQQRFRAMSTNELINANAEDLNSKILYSAPYGVNNSMRYLSIPMQAGYLLVNKTFGVQLNAGVATDLFLQNTISADSDHLEKTSQPAGSDSPYRAVNLSGLLGTEFSYRFGENYRVSLNPGIRYPFNTIYKSELGVQSTPLTFDVGLRFRYIFN